MVASLRLLPRSFCWDSALHQPPIEHFGGGLVASVTTRPRLAEKERVHEYRISVANLTTSTLLAF